MAATWRSSSTARDSRFTSISNNVVSVKSILSTLLPALRGARHFGRGARHCYEIRWITSELPVPIIYHELLRLARARLSRENRDCTLEPTALVHECYLRLADETRLHWQNRGHFLCSGRQHHAARADRSGQEAKVAEAWARRAGHVANWHGCRHASAPSCGTHTHTWRRVPAAGRLSTVGVPAGVLPELPQPNGKVASIRAVQHPPPRPD